MKKSVFTILFLLLLGISGIVITQNITIKPIQDIATVGVSIVLVMIMVYWILSNEPTNKPKQSGNEEYPYNVKLREHMFILSKDWKMIFYQQSLLNQVNDYSFNGRMVLPVNVLKKI